MSLALTLAITVVVTQAPAPRVEALIIGNNASLTPGRQKLSYADDDAVKYALMLRLFAKPEDIRLLTELDGDSKQLYSAVRIDGPPTARQVDAQFMALANRAAASAPGSSEIFIIFAGHGDVERGEGFIELADGRMTAAGLQARLKALAPQRVQLILDSCNSFFMLNPRKSGSRRFATSEDSSKVFSDQLPHVGVILSTSAENEVYEWSELQSGIFSHLVRSASSGAADADGDGVIRFDELEAFVTVASRSIPNPLYRPRLFVRAQEGGHTPLFRLGASAAATRLLIEPGEPSRVSIRDGHGIRWVDAHVDGRQLVTVEMPVSVDDELDIEARGKRWVVSSSRLGTTIRLGALEQAPVLQVARGAHAELAHLFDEPFGAAEVKAAAEAAAAPKVFGISKSDGRRLQLIVESAVSIEENRRGAALATSVLTGVLTTVPYLMLATLDEKHTDSYLIAAAIGLSGSVGAGILNFRRQKRHVRLRELGQELTRRDDVTATLLELDGLAQEMVEQSRRDRKLGLVFGGIVMGLAVATQIPFEILAAQRADFVEPRNQFRFSTGNSFIIGLSMLMNALLLNDSTEALNRMWNEDPVIGQAPAVSIGLMPMTGGFFGSASVQF